MHADGYQTLLIGKIVVEGKYEHQGFKSPGIAVKALSHLAGRPNEPKSSSKVLYFLS